MTDLNRQEATHIVKFALRTVADFIDSTDIENFDFIHFTHTHKIDFINALKTELINKGFDAPLSIEVMDDWITVRDCVDYLTENSTVTPI